MTRRVLSLGLVVLALVWLTYPRPEPLNAAQQALLAGGRTRLGDQYDADFYAQGYPPKGHSACTDVVYFASRKLGIDLQEALARDMARAPEAYPAHRERAINHLWCPNLIVWFQRTQQTLPRDRDFRPGDVVFWCWRGDGVPDHVGLVTSARGPMILHQAGICQEEPMPSDWPVIGHFRFWRAVDDRT